MEKREALLESASRDCSIGRFRIRKSCESANLTRSTFVMHYDPYLGFGLDVNSI